MTTMVAELYQALKSAGVDDAIAQRAAAAVLGADEKAALVTRADLAEAETRIIKWNLGALGFLAVIYGAITAAVRVLG